LANALAIVDKAFASLKGSEAEKAAGYVKGLETRLARAQRDSEYQDSLPAKLAGDGLRLLGAAARGGIERGAEAYGQGDAWRRAAPYLIGISWGASAASGWDTVREVLNGALLIDVYEVARGQEVRHAAAAAALAEDPRYAQARAFLLTSRAEPAAATPEAVAEVVK
jgi:hypothetical protein